MEHKLCWKCREKILALYCKYGDHKTSWTDTFHCHHDEPEERPEDTYLFSPKLWSKKIVAEYCRWATDKLFFDIYTPNTDNFDEWNW
jgi:hypothetical protein